MAAAQQRERKWFSAHLIFRCRVGDALELDPLCEDRVVLFYAVNEAAAREAALGYGEREQQTYRNENGELVEWRFAGVDQLEELAPDPEEAGWEVASRHFRPSDLAHDRDVENRAGAD